VRAPDRRYDLILVSPPVPVHAPEAAALTTVEALRRWHSLLKTGGLLAVRVPQAYFAASLPRIIGTVRSQFVHFGVYRLAGPVLILASDAPIAGGSRALLERLPKSAAKDDPGFKDFVEQVDWDLDPRDPELEAAKPETRDLSRNALPFWDILTARRPGT
jgi:hypothetical protein